MTTTTPTPALATYRVEPNYCDCHVETCCCDPYVVVGPDGAKPFTQGSKKKAEEIAALLNELTLARRAAQPVAPVQQNGKREGFEAAAKALQERAAGHFRNKDYKLQDECLQCASMLHDMKPAATPSPQVAEGAELPTAGWALKRDNGTGFGNWLFQTKEGAEKHGEPGDGYSVVALVEREAIAASRRAAGGEVVLPAEPTDALLVACGWEEWRPGNYVDRGAATARYNAIRAAAGATPAPASAGQAEKPFAGPGEWFSVNVLGNPMREYAPGKWESAVWPSDNAGQAAPVPLVAKLTALRNEAEAERQSETDTSRKHICEGMSLAFGAAAILAAQPAEGAGQAGQVAKWHAPGMGEVHYHDHSLMIDCQREIDDPSQDYIADDELAKRVCAALNATERAAAPADLHKRVIQFALDLAEHENDDAVVSFLKAWNSEDVGYLRSNWPDFDATHQPSAQDGGN